MSVKTPTYTIETTLLDEYSFIAGVDEVGRGPIAGPVVSAAVILDPKKVGKYRTKKKWWYEIRDSKLMSATKREQLATIIKEEAIDWGIGVVSHKEVDMLNVHYAALLSMKRAIESMKKTPELALLDGKYSIPDLDIMQKTYTGGDAQILSIAAASIIAKVYRDDLMMQYAHTYDVYGFEKHKGYDTFFHREQLRTYGACDIHRRSFQTVKDLAS